MCIFNVYYLVVPDGSQSTGQVPLKGHQINMRGHEMIHVRRKRKSSDAQINISTYATMMNTSWETVSMFVTTKASDIYDETLEQCAAEFVSTEPANTIVP